MDSRGVIVWNKVAQSRSISLAISYTSNVNGVKESIATSCCSRDDLLKAYNAIIASTQNAPEEVQVDISLQGTIDNNSVTKSFQTVHAFSQYLLDHVLISTCLETGIVATPATTVEKPPRVFLFNLHIEKIRKFIQLGQEQIIEPELTANAKLVLGLLKTDPTKLIFMLAAESGGEPVTRLKNLLTRMQQCEQPQIYSEAIAILASDVCANAMVDHLMASLTNIDALFKLFDEAGQQKLMDGLLAQRDGVMQLVTFGHDVHKEGECEARLKKLKELCPSRAEKIDEAYKMQAEAPYINSSQFLSYQRHVAFMLRGNK